jgi:hypothetical protein
MKEKGASGMFTHTQVIRTVLVAAATFTGLESAAIHAQSDFVTAVTAAHPIAYYRLDNMSGKSVVGTTTWKSTSGVTWAAPGAPVGIPNNHFAKFDGHDGQITTTQIGGVSTAASIMAWVNLAALPSKENHLVYVAGESEVGNDLDVQFDTDDALKFWTAAGGHITYAPPAGTLLNQWHMIIATLDTSTHSRAIYWDGKSVATDKGGGEAGKKTVFTIGATPVFAGRFFKGGIEEVALWNRALSATEVASIYGAAKPGTASAIAANAGAPAASPSGTSSPTPTTGPFATKATVQIEDDKGEVKLKREEEIAYIFLSGIEIIEHNCQLTLQRTCPMDQMLSGSYPKGAIIEHLKFDPNKTDPDYTYTLATGGMAWEAHANPKKPGLKGFCFMARDVGITIVTYSNSGPAGYTSTAIGNRGMQGDSFAVQ